MNYNRSIPMFVFLGIFLFGFSTALASPVGWLHRDSDEFVWMGDPVTLTAELAFDHATALKAVGLQPGSKVWAEDRDHDVFEAEVMGARSDDEGGYLVRVSVTNRQPDFDLLIHKTKPKRKGGGKGFHVESKMQKKAATIQKMGAWMVHHMNYDVFKVQDYGTAYEFEQFHLPIPKSSNWLIAHRYYDDDGKAHAQIWVCQVKESTLPKPPSVKILSKIDGYFLNNMEWFDSNRNGKPDIKVEAADGSTYGWKLMEVSGTSLSILSGPSKVVTPKPAKKEEKKTPELKPPTAP